MIVVSLSFFVIFISNFSDKQGFLSIVFSELNKRIVVNIMYIVLVFGFVRGVFRRSIVVNFCDGIEGTVNQSVASVVETNPIFSIIVLQLYLWDSFWKGNVENFEDMFKLQETINFHSNFVSHIQRILIYKNSKLRFFNSKATS